MPLIRRCPKCGDDLSLDEEICVFCGYLIGRAGWFERFRFFSEDWYLPLALIVVVYLAGLEAVTWLLGLAAPGASAWLRSSPIAAWALRYFLAVAAMAALLPPHWRRRAWPRKRSGEGSAAKGQIAAKNRADKS